MADHPDSYREHLARWETRYAEPGYAYGSDPNDFLVETAGNIPAGRVLCLAEGQGRNAVYLAGLGHWVAAVDRSLAGLRRAGELARERHVHVALVAADLSTFRIAPAFWHGIVSIFGHLPPDARATVHRAAVAGLRPGGVFVLEAYSPRQLAFRTGGPPDEALLMSLDRVKAELAGLRFDIAREVEREVVEGRYHRGRAAVIQILGVKVD